MISSAGVRFASNDGGFRITALHVGMGFRAGRFSGLRHASVARSYSFTGRIGGNVPSGGFHGGMAGAR